VGLEKIGWTESIKKLRSMKKGPGGEEYHTNNKKWEG
jgi:hypothetical protein